MLLNTKSIIECDEYEEVIHNKEIEMIENEICKLPNYDCLVVFRYVDEYHKEKEQQTMSCQLHEFLSMMEYSDIKNGIDIKIGDNNILTITAYGQAYKVGEKWYTIEEEILIMPLDENNDFIDLSNTLKNINMSNNLN